MRGEYSHAVDGKGRLFIPAKFREKLGTTFIVTRGVGQYLSVYPMDLVMPPRMPPALLVRVFT